MATCDTVEHADEPWLPMILPMMVDQQLIHEDIAREMFKTYTCELLNDMILLRNANFRHHDLSSIWNQKMAVDIFNRIFELKNRSDVALFIQKYNPLLLYNLAETLPFVKFFINTLPNCKFLFVVRKGLEVAQEVREKRWFSDEQLLHPINAQIYHPFKYKDKTYHLPWWVQIHESEMFIHFSDLERAMYYWCVLMEKGLLVFDTVPNDSYTFIKYESLVSDPKHVLKLTTEYLNIKPNPLTQMTLSKICKSKNLYFLKRTNVPHQLRDRIFALYHRFGYE